MIRIEGERGKYKDGIKLFALYVRRGNVSMGNSYTVGGLCALAANDD